MLKVLRGEDFDENEKATHKIEINTLEIEHPEEKNIKMQLNCWDFGAQDIYRATHQFFLTDRSLFLLVWDARVGWEDSNVKYWLKTVSRIAPEAPIILVANKIDSFSNPYIPVDDLKTTFPQIQDLLEISCKENRGIEQLRKKIAKCAVKLPVMGDLLPSTWIDAIIGIRETSNNVHFLTIEDFVFKLADEFKILPNSVKILMEYLHEIGNIIYFPENSELDNYVILDPQWISEYISKVLDDEEVKRRNGILTPECKKRIWKGLDLSSQNVLTSIIKQLELGCSIKDTQDTDEHILIVERITQGKTKECVEKWNAINQYPEISIKFEFDTDIPKGMPGYFIARTNKYSTGLYWASGVLLTDSDKEDNLALLEVFRDKRYVQLTVRGLNPKDFFDELKFIIENIFSRFKGAKIIRKVPCPGHENNQPCEMQGEFDYYKLKRDREFGKTFSRCPVTDKKVPILISIYFTFCVGIFLYLSQYSNNK